MIPLVGAAKPYKAGVLAEKICPQRLHVKPLGHIAKYVEKIKKQQESKIIKE